MKIRLIDPPLAMPRYRQVRLPTVAAEIAPYADVEINDENIESIDESPVDLVGITAQVYNAPRAFHLASQFRERGIKTILGGPYATAMPQHALEHFDAVVVGEVEGLGEQIVGDFEKGRLEGIYRLEQPPRDWGSRLPRRDLQNANAYYWLNYPIEFSRGCPHRCSFCFGRYAHPTFRKRSLASIAQDLAGWDHGLIEAVDLHFAADRQHIIEVCRLMEQLGVGGWFGEATLHSLDDEEVLTHLQRSNCVMVFVGIESIDQNTLKGANKGFNLVDDYRRIIQRVQDHGIFVHAGLMWGLDGQTSDSFEATARFCQETNIYLASTNIAAYYPGTAAFEQLQRSGRIVTEDLRKYDSAHVVVTPSDLSEGEVLEGAKRFLKRFYGFGSIFRRSFQAPNYRFTKLFDFWGLNLVYRAYYKLWARRLGKTDTPWKDTGATDTFPHMGGRMPFIYSASNWLGKLFHYWYRGWFSRPKPTSLATTASLTFIVAMAAVGLFWQGQGRAEAHWPLVWPPTWVVATCFGPVCLIWTWLLTRLARTVSCETLDEPTAEGEAEPGATAGAKQQRGIARFSVLLLAHTPMVLCVAALPPYASGWAFVLSLLTLLFCLKGWSVLSCSNPAQHRNPWRVASFVLLYPTLDFAEAFQVDGTKRCLTRHLPLLASGALKLAVGVVLFPALFYLVLQGLDRLVLGWIGQLGRLVVLYLVLAGCLEWLTAYWRMAGYTIPAPFGRRSLGPAGPAGLWRSWNTPLHRWLVRHVYVPLGGSSRPLRATVFTFLASGLMFVLLLTPVMGRPAWEVGLFFAGNGLVVGLEKKIVKKGAESTLPWRLTLYLAAILLMLSTGPLLFTAIDRIFLST